MKLGAFCVFCDGMSSPLVKALNVLEENQIISCITVRNLLEATGIPIVYFFLHSLTSEISR